MEEFLCKIINWLRRESFYEIIIKNNNIQFEDILTCFQVVDLFNFSDNVHFRSIIGADDQAQYYVSMFISFYKISLASVWHNDKHFEENIGLYSNCIISCHHFDHRSTFFK